MRIDTIFHSPGFERSFRKLARRIQEQTVERESQFRIDCFDPRLKTHKLSGALEGEWAFSVTYKYRILFRFIRSGEVVFDDVGDHSIYN